MIRFCLLLLALSLPAAVGAQSPPRDPQCVAANDEVTKHRLGKDRAGKLYRVDLQRAVAAGRAAEGRCRGDGGFMLAYALARIDLSKDTDAVQLKERTALFNSAVQDLALVRRYVQSGQSDRYEVFNVLGLIYHDIGQYQESIDVLNASAPFFKKMTKTSRQNTFFTKGMALYQLGRNAEAAVAFGYAKRFGHALAAQWESSMRAKK